MTRVREADDLVTVGFLGDFKRLLRGLVDIRHTAAGEGEVERVEQRGDDVCVGRVQGLDILPRLKLVAYLGIVLLHYLEERLLVKLLAGILFDETDDLLHLGEGVFVRCGVLPAHRDARNHGGDRDAALDELAVHGRRVAGHIVRDEACADPGVIVVDRNAGGVCAETAGVGGQTRIFHDIHVKRSQTLIHVCAEKPLKHFKRQRLELREAGDYLRAHGLLKHNEFIGILRVTEAAVALHAVGNHLGRALHNGVHLCVRHAQSGAAHTGHAFIDHVQTAEVGAEPAVLKHTAHDAHRGLRNELHQQTEVHDPLCVVVKCILEAAPLAVLCDAAALDETLSVVCHHCLPP